MYFVFTHLVVADEGHSTSLANKERRLQNYVVKPKRPLKPTNHKEVMVRSFALLCFSNSFNGSDPFSKYSIEVSSNYQMVL